MTLDLVVLAKEHEAARQRLLTIRGGEQQIYFRGYPGEWKETESAQELFQEARRLYEAKLLFLTQRRVPNTNSVFEYIATGRGPKVALTEDEQPKARVTVVRGGPAPFDMPAGF